MGPDRMKAIGVLGGLGPQATIEFESLVLAASQRLIPPSANAGYPPMLVAHYRHSLVELDGTGRPLVPLRPDSRFLEAASRIGPHADFVVIVSNGAHRFAEQVERAAGKPLLSMTRIVVDEVQRRGWRKVGLLTYFDPGIYSFPLTGIGIFCEVLAPEAQGKLDQGILAVMEGRVTAAHESDARAAVADLKARGVDGILLGCTEVPYLLPEPARNAPDMLDPLPLLAEAAVRRSIA